MDAVMLAILFGLALHAAYKTGFQEGIDHEKECQRKRRATFFKNVFESLKDDRE